MSDMFSGGLARQPIGVFDSGVGGLSVWQEIVRLIPNESTIYLADQAHVPYGARSQPEIRALTHAAVTWLLEQGAKMAVIACNTASAAALNSLRERWPEMPIVGMEPAVKPASEQTIAGRVGVMATPGTLHAERFASLVERFASGVEVYTQVCPGLVEMVEAGKVAGPEVDTHLHGLLDTMLAKNIDRLVLGCTHYSFLKPAIQLVTGPGVTLVDPAPAVARQVYRVLADQQLLAPADSIPEHFFYTSGNLESLQKSLLQLVDVASTTVVMADFLQEEIDV